MEPCNQKDKINEIDAEVKLMRERLNHLHTKFELELDNLKVNFAQRIEYLIEKIDKLEKFQSRLTWWIIGLCISSIGTLAGIIITLLTLL